MSNHEPLDVEAKQSRLAARDKIAPSPPCEASLRDGNLPPMAKSRGPRVRPSKAPGPEKTRSRDADGTQARILSAATEEFAENGYSGARVDAICRAARANPR